VKAVRKPEIAVHRNREANIMAGKEEIEAVRELGYMIYPALLGLPRLLILLAGLGYSIYKFRQYRKPALLTIIALTLSLLTQAFSVIYPFVVNRLLASDYGSSSVLTMNIALNTSSSLIGSLALILLLIAVWSERPK
jgi:cytochrome bd-type quinol oxidase subunit 2